MAAAAAAILVLLNRTASSANVIALASEIIGVTTRAVRRVLGEGPYERAADCAAVTATASRVSPVVARVVATRIMTEDIRCPALGGMAYVALYIRVQVTRWLGPRTASRIIVTVIASARTAGIVRPGASDEGRRGVTEMTIQRGRDMGAVFAGRSHPVTGRAVVDDPGMIEPCANEAAGRVTNTAVLIGRNVAGRFTDREHIIVARAAIIYDTCMTKACRDKACGNVTNIAILIGRHMVRWRRLASGRGAVVARRTTIDNTRVIEMGAGEGGRNVAQGAILGGWQMICGLTGCLCPIVARGAVVDDTAVTKHRRREAARDMANSTILVGRDVARVFADRTTGTTVMAAVATLADDFRPGMIDIGSGKAHGVMACSTILIGAAMNRRIRCTQRTDSNMTRIAIVTGGTVAGDAGVRKYRGLECLNGMAEITILPRRHMTCRLE